MDALFVSQVLSLEAPQNEIDHVSKRQQAVGNVQVTEDLVFLKALNRSMHEVGELMESEQEDLDLKDEEEKEEQE